MISIRRLLFHFFKLEKFKLNNLKNIIIRIGIYFVIVEYVVFSIQKYPKKIYFRASASAIKVKGTTAFIKEGLWYSIYDLMIGMMLPSGNDAAMVLAENFGRLIIMERARISSISLKD